MYIYVPINYFSGKNIKNIRLEILEIFPYSTLKQVLKFCIGHFVFRDCQGLLICSIITISGSVPSVHVATFRVYLRFMFYEGNLY